MKSILNTIIFITTFLLSTQLYSAENKNYVSVNPIVNSLNTNSESTKCAAVSYEGLDVVHPQDYSICQTDISYGILEMVFQKIFSENTIIPSLAGRKNNDSSLAYAYNIGGPIIAIIESITWLTFTLSGLVLTFVAIKTLYLSANSGQFMGNWNSVFVMTRTLGAMALIVPIGSFSIAQILILVLSIFGIMGGNYIWGAFLSMQQASSVSLNMDGDMSEVLALDQAESLVQTQTCSLRSAAASIEINQKNLPDSFFDVGIIDHMSRLSSCSRNSLFLASDQNYTTYSASDPIYDDSGNIKNPGNAFPLSTIAFGSPKSCRSSTDLFDAYDEDVYGGNYQCGNIKFDTASLSDFTDNDAEIDNEGWFTSTKKDIIKAIQSQKDKQNPSKLYSDISSKASKNSINGKNFSKDDYTAEVAKLKGDLSTTGKAIFNKIKLNINSNSLNPPAAYEGTYVTLSAIFNNYLGGSYDSSSFNEFWNLFLESKIDILNASITINSLIPIDPEEENDLDFSPMYSDARKAAAFIMSAQCAREWGTLYSNYDSTVYYLDGLRGTSNDAILDPDMEDYMGNGSINGNCIIPLNDQSNLDYLTMMELDSDLPDATDGDTSRFYLTLLNPEGSNYRDILLSFSTNTSETRDVELKLAKNEIEKYSIIRAKAIIEGMRAYNYVIRQATKEAIKEIFQEETNTDLLINMRNLGWASAGGFILALSNNGSDLSKYNNLIQSQVSWTSAISNDKYVNSKVLLRSQPSFSFKSLESVTSNIFRKASVISDDNEDLQLTKTYSVGSAEIFKYIEDLITAPLSHLKGLGGFDQNKTLRDGAKDCYEKNDCTITDIHPVTALLRVGNDLIELCINLVIIKAITGAILAAKYMGQRNGGGTAKGNGVMNSLLSGAMLSNPLIKVIFVLVEMVDKILGIITSMIVPPLFIVGIFFSFVIPMMPFIAFLMGFIGWIMLIFELLIAINVWVILMATPDQNGGSRVDPRSLFGFAGQLVLKPGLMVVGLVFGWYLSAISVYFLNMTIFGALSPTESGSFIGLLDVFMFYIVYLIMIFIAIKHSFKIIETLPDKIFSLINIQKSGDVKSDSLGMERLIQLAAGEKVLSLATTPMNLIDRKKDQLKYEVERMKTNLSSDKVRQGLKEIDNITNSEADIEKAMNENNKDDKDNNLKNIADAEENLVGPPSPFKRNEQENLEGSPSPSKDS